MPGLLGDSQVLCSWDEHCSCSAGHSRVDSDGGMALALHCPKLSLARAFASGGHILVATSNQTGKPMYGLLGSWKGEQSLLGITYSQTRYGVQTTASGIHDWPFVE